MSSSHMKKKKFTVAVLCAGRPTATPGHADARGEGAGAQARLTPAQQPGLSRIR